MNQASVIEAEKATEEDATRLNFSVRPPLHVLVLLTFGLGLFRAVNSNSYLSAVLSEDESFLFVPNLSFNIVVAVAVIGVSAIVVVLAFRGRIKPLSMPYILPTVLLFFSQIASAAGLFALLPPMLSIALPGVLFGIYSVMLSLTWIEFLSLQKPSWIVFQIAGSMIINALYSPMLSHVSPSIQAAVNCGALVVMVLCARFARTYFGRLTLDDIIMPRQENCTVQGYKKVILYLSDAIVVFFVMEAVIGFLNSFMLADQIGFAGSESASRIGMLIGCVVFALAILLVQRLPKVSTVFRVVVPILAAMLVFLPFLSESYNMFFSVTLLASYYFIAMLISYSVADASRTYQVSAYVVMGVVSGIARICLLTALIVGNAAGSLEQGMFAEAEDTMRFLVIIVVAIYVLSMTLVFISRDHKKRKSVQRNQSDILAEGEKLEKAVSPLEEQCSVLADEHGLTERESEIMLLLAKGRTNAYIAKLLYVTENTVRSHVRNIYSKMNVHTRQDLIDLVEDDNETAIIRP